MIKNVPYEAINLAWIRKVQQTYCSVTVRLLFGYCSATVRLRTRKKQTLNYKTK